MQRSLWILLAIAACAVPEETTSVTVQAAGGYCGVLGCPSNTATGPDGRLFDEFDWSGAKANRAGIRMIGGVLLGGTPVKVYADGPRMLARDEANTIYEGIQLIHMIITLEHEETGQKYEVLVDKVDLDAVPFWAGDLTQTLTIYWFKARFFGETVFKVDVCGGEAVGADWTASPHAAFVFDADRYDSESITVSSSLGQTWMNIACAGAYPAKMLLLRHAHAGSLDASGTPTWVTTIPQRTTMLKAITADYPGNGTSYTLTGTLLRYADSKDIKVDSLLTPPLASGYRMEAIWGENGVVCLEEPRLSTTLVPRILVDPTGTEIPRCGDIADWKTRGHVITAAP
jgi:hypothetical protein